MRSVPAGVIACVLLAFLALASCAGGGDEPAVAALPGTLWQLALEGTGAQGTSGTFLAIPLQPYMDVAEGGWAAFVAPTSDPVRTEVAYVAQPDGVVVPVFCVGDPAPAPADGQIAGFGGVWVTPGGIVFAHVTVAGDSGGRSFGLVSARVEAGSAASLTGVIYHLASLTPAGAAGTLEAIDTFSPVVEQDATFWFLGRETGTMNSHLLSIEWDGSAFGGRALTGGVLTSGVTLAAIDAFAVDPTGQAYALAARTHLADQRIYVRSTAGGGFLELMREGDGLPGGGTLVQAYKGGRLNVYAVGQVVWMGIGSAPSPDDVFLFADVSGPAGRAELARSGTAMPGASGGVLSNLNALNQASASLIPQFGATLVAAGNGVTFGTVGALSQSGPLAFGTAHLQSTDVGPLGATYVGLSNTTRPYTEISRDGSFLFANQLAAGGSALLWAIPGVGVFGLAVQGAPIGGAGDTFGSFAVTSAHAVADGVALFRAPLAVAGSGIFRQGP